MAREATAARLRRLLASFARPHPGSAVAAIAVLPDSESAMLGQWDMERGKSPCFAAPELLLHKNIAKRNSLCIDKNKKCWYAKFLSASPVGEAGADRLRFSRPVGWLKNGTAAYLRTARKSLGDGSAGLMERSADSWLR
jgi:hypothetical protein